LRSPTIRGLWAVLLASALAAPVQGQAGDAPTVAVGDFNGFLLGEAGNSAPVGKAVAVMLVTEFSGRPGLQVIERQQLRQIIEEQKLALSGLVDENQAVEIGRLLGVRYYFFGQASGVAGTLRLDVRAVDVETSEIVTVLKLSGRTEELLDMVVRIADDFAGMLDLDAPAERPDVQDVPAMATIEFSRAIDYEDKGEVEQAIEHYRKALEIHPAHEGARRALERLESGGDR